MLKQIKAAAKDEKKKDKKMVTKCVQIEEIPEDNTAGRDAIRKKSGRHGGWQVCQICGDGVGTVADGELFTACDVCAYPVCRPCYEYERKDNTQACPQWKTKYKRHKGSPPARGDESKAFDMGNGKGKAKELSPQDTALLIQLNYRVHLAHGSQVLRRDLAVAKAKLKELMSLFYNLNYRCRCGYDHGERQRFSEKIIVLLLTVDALEQQYAATRPTP